MGSPITLSGVNGIDWNLILNAVMAQEHRPADQLTAKKAELEGQKAALGTLLSKLTTLDSAISALSTTSSINPSKATSSSGSIDVSAGTSATPGTYNVVVSQLARAQVLASSSTYSSLDAVVATGGSLTFTPATGDPLVVTLSGSTTLSELAAQINAASDSPVTANVVQSLPGSYQLVFTAKNTGVANAFTVSSTLSGGEGLTFAESGTPNGIYGDEDAELVLTARNAQFTVNGLPVQSTTNVVTSVVPGATLTLKKQDPAETVAITVSRDTDEAASRLQKFIDAYNDVVQFGKDQDAAALAGKTNVARNPLLRGFRNDMRSAVQGSYVADGPFTQLAQVGLGFDRTGKLTLDKTVFAAASAASPNGVQTLISGLDGSGGVFGALAEKIAVYADAGGQISLSRERMTTQAKTIQARLDAFEARLAVRRSTLQREFQAAERLMTQLNGQGSSLSQLGTQFRSF